MAQTKSIQSENVYPSVINDFFDNDRFFNNRWLEKQFNQSLPAVNISEKDNEFNIEFAAPGFKKQDFKIHIEESLLTISAEKQEEKNEDNKRFTRKEFSYNSFSRSFTLPQNVNVEKIDAKYDDGILKLHIPKIEESKTLRKKEIEVA